MVCKYLLNGMNCRDVFSRSCQPCTQSQNARLAAHYTGFCCDAIQYSHDILPYQNSLKSQLNENSISRTIFENPKALILRAADCSKYDYCLKPRIDFIVFRFLPEDTFPFVPSFKMSFPLLMSTSILPHNRFSRPTPYRTVRVAHEVGRICRKTAKIVFPELDSLL